MMNLFMISPAEGSTGNFFQSFGLVAGIDGYSLGGVMLSAVTNSVYILILLAIAVGLYFIHKNILASQSAEYLERISDLKSKLEKSGDAKSELTKLKSLNQELSGKIGDSEAIKKKFDQTLKENDQLKIQLSSLDNQYKTLQEANTKQIRDLESSAMELAKKDEKLEDTEKVIQDLTKKVAELTQDQQLAKQLRADLDHKNAGLAQAQQTIQQLRAALDSKSAGAAQAAKSNLQTQELAEAYAIIEAQKAHLLKSEKMAALGELTPAIAHEFNNPLSVLKTGANLIHDKLSQIFSVLHSVESKLNADNRILFWQIVANALKGNPALPSEQERRMRSSIVRKLEDYDVENFEVIADQIVKMGLHENFENYIDFFRERFAGEAFKIVYEIDSIIRQLGRMKISGEMAQKIIDALKGYVRDKAETFSLDENIETVFILYEIRLSHNKINVEKNFEFRPKLNGFPGQLMQVWTNLLTNSEFALKEYAEKMPTVGSEAFKPVIKVSVKREGASAVVRFEDNGPGIPKEIQSKVFETLFTTKESGAGTGYGLSLCKEIMEKHKGDIKLDSEPGRTTFILNFPLDV